MLAPTLDRGLCLAAESIVEAGVLPEGVLSLICGSTGDLLDRLGAHDVLAFTGSGSFWSSSILCSFNSG